MKQVNPFCIFLLLLAFISPLSNAQSVHNTDYNLWQSNIRDTFWVFGNTANVRTEPGLAGAIQDSLVCGTLVTTQKEEYALDNVKGIFAPWVKVYYQRNGKNKEGYLWLGMLALGRCTKGDISFLYGIEKIAAAKDEYGPVMWHIKAKAVAANGHLLDEQEWKMDGREMAATEGKLLGDLGLSNTEDILRISFGGEACGVPTHYFYFGWTGNKLLPLPGKMGVSDAGVYYHSETFLFPKESGGQPDKIIKLTEEGEADEEKVDKDGAPVFKIKKSRQVWLWNGNKAVKAK